MLFLGLLPVCAHAACPDDDAVAAYVADVAAARVSAGFGSEISPADAACARRKLVAALPAVLGKRIGYKAAFTSEASQARFGVDGPRWAAMFDRQMFTGGAILPAAFGARPLYEADLVVVVGDAGLADAATPLEALQHLSHVVPFIELPDLMLEGTPSGNALVATNVAFRGGVLGKRIPLERGQAQLDALARMTVMVEEGGKPVAQVPGRALMDNPANAALWLARGLRRDGIELQPGDLLSLGGFTAPAPARPGTTVTVRYQGLPGDPAVSVRFE